MRAAQRNMRTLLNEGTAVGLTDGELLERFVSRSGGSEVAFRALVARHGAMVLGVCRRVLSDANDADDAFQATFLILIRKAHEVRVTDSLGRWLYGVSHRVSVRARANAARRSARERPADQDLAARPDRDADARGLRAVIDEELGALPERLQAPLVLCDLDGFTHEEAARQLGCPVGTVKSRLSRGRERLRLRLLRRGVAPSAGLAALPRGSEASGAGVPPGLAESVARAGASYAAGQTPYAEDVSITGLAEGVLKSMSATKLKWIAITALALAAAASGPIVYGLQATGGERAEPLPTALARTQNGEPNRDASETAPVRPFVDPVLDDVELLTVRLGGKRHELEQAEAKRQVALTLVAVYRRLNERQKGQVSVEEIAKAEAEVNVQQAQVGIASAGVREYEILLERAKQRHAPDRSQREAAARDRADATGPQAALERRVADLERKLDDVMKDLAELKGKPGSRRPDSR